MNSIKVANQLKGAGELEQAISKYRQIIKYNPNFYWAYYEIGAALARQGNFEDAINQLELALTINPFSDCCSYYLGKVLFQQGKLLRAAKFYRKAVHTNSA